MMTYRRWTWTDATDEQMEDPINTAAINRLADEARSIYDSIPEPGDERYAERMDHIYESAYESCPEGGEAARKFAQAAIDAHRAKQRAKWGELEALEEMIAARGARFARDYEHWNEDEAYMERMENPSDY